MRIILILLVLAGCGRGLTNAERALINPIMGPTFNANNARLVEAGFIGMTTRTYAARPQVTCRERINPPPDGPTIQTRTAGAVAWTHVLTNPDWTLPDYADGFPNEFNLVAAMYFAHEMVHIWQWQNRGITGYSPFRGLAEHKRGVDPYLFDPQEQINFLDLGYEQQAAVVEEFICCRTIAPEGARTERLWQTLSAVMPVQHPTQTPKATRVFGVYENADLDGVCD
ncbi:hypothetical protein L0664_12850 [Octadecabacter sp. G9-8]|uniref:Plant Basic Secretory Protein n=1 Tax=Octadecabacter dasysiphoniae TaxID=2909341 RepID=A0ABS9CXI8_9RHOB|nr:hypothetical protein [Octadecabacter dasysiphoniae]MCF2871960.1 hypothetical protein [Octadecabacter dasysiphoniae]